MANSLGSLFIDIQARTATLESDVNKIKQQLDGVRSATDKTGESAKSAFKSFQLFSSFQGRGMTGISLDTFSFFTLLQAVKKEILYVIENIEKIPGIPAETVANVMEFRMNLASARAYVDSFIAAGISGFTQFGKMVGAGFAAVFYGEEAMDASLKAQLESLDKIKAVTDPTYYEKVRAAFTKLSETKKADALAEMTAAQKIEQLRKNAATQEAYAKSASIDSLQRIQAQTKAYQDLTEADKLHLGLVQKYNSEVQRWSTEQQRINLDEMSMSQRILYLKQKIDEVNKQMVISRKPGEDLKLTDVELERINKAFPQLIAFLGMYRTELNKVRTASMEWRDMTVSLASQLDDYLVSLTTGGKSKIEDFLKTISDAILQTFFKLAVINPLLNALFGTSKGWTTLATLFTSGGKADGGPARGLTLVGERGPELVNLGSGSSVIPNHAIQNGRGGDTYYVDARGADEARIAQLERALMSINASVERRAFAAISNARTRRGAAGAAI